MWLLIVLLLTLCPFFDKALAISAVLRPFFESLRHSMINRSVYMRLMFFLLMVSPVVKLLISAFFRNIILSITLICLLRLLISKRMLSFSFLSSSNILDMDQ